MKKQRVNIFIRKLGGLFLTGFFIFIFHSELRAESIENDIKEITVNGTTLHYKEKGKGETLIMVHGSLGSLHDPNAQFDEFSKKYRVISYSRRYHPPNRAPIAGDIYSLELHTADLAALIDALDVGPVHLVGHSYGAYILLSLVIERPELVNRLVLAEPPAFPLVSRSLVGRAVEDSWKKNTFYPTIRAFENNSPSDAIKTFLYWVSGSSGWFEKIPEADREYMLSKKFEFRLEVMTDYSIWMPDLDWGSLSSINRPVLLLSGDRSPTMFYLVIVELEKILKSESYVMVPNAGHLLPSENASFYNQIVLDFLEKN